MRKNNQNNKLVKIVIYSIIFFLILWLLWRLDIFGQGNITSFKNKTILVAEQEINIKIAKTPNQKEIGLGNIKSLPANEGLLFVYDDYLIPSYWMKDMEFSIDIIWIKDNVVVGYEKDLKPQDDNINLPTYQPKVFINYVLEVNSGFVDKYGLKIGDSVKLSI